MNKLDSILPLLKIKQLNEFQKKVMDVFLNTQKNILMSAPTGIGKTLAMQLMMFLNEPRIVYASPLKSLSMQVYNELQGLLSVELVTGDVYLDDAENVKGNVIMTTYEKFDSVLRRPYKWISETKLLIVDELHNMRYERRSEAIELVLEWALENNVRVVTASATLSGLEKIANWLNAEIIDATQRPVPLFEYVKFGNMLIDKNGKAHALKHDFIDMILKSGKNIMIFENTRKRAESLATELKSRYGDIVTVFHAGLDKEERARLLKDIESGKYKIVVSTTALGQGVNLPIYCVLFKEMKLPEVENGRFVGWREIDVSEYKQIAGRAGRPRFDKEGIAVIEAKSETEARKYLKKYLNSSVEEIKSYLTPFKFILVQISRHETMRTYDLIDSFKYTYSLKDTPKKEIQSTLEVMENLDLIKFQNVNGDEYIFLTPLGRATSYSYLDLEDIEYYRNYLNQDDIDIYYVIANSPKVIEQGKGADTYGMIRDWIEGSEESELTKYGMNITVTDVRNILATATWQSFSFYALLRALNDKKQNDALFAWLRIESGVPRNALNLVKVQGIGRKLAIFLSKHGYTTKTEICQNLDKVIKIMQSDEKMKNQTWRIEQICEKKRKQATLV